MSQKLFTTEVLVCGVEHTELVADMDLWAILEIVQNNKRGGNIGADFLTLHDVRYNERMLGQAGGRTF